MSTIILLLVILGTIALCRYAIYEGRRVEQHNQLIKNMNEYERKHEEVHRTIKKRKAK